MNEKVNQARVVTLARRFLILWYADGHGANGNTCDAAIMLAEALGLDVGQVMAAVEASERKREARGRA